MKSACCLVWASVIAVPKLFQLFHPIGGVLAQQIYYPFVRNAFERAFREASTEEEFTDIIGRNFRQPKEGLGFDNSPVAHMWRAMIRPAKYL